MKIKNLKINGRLISKIATYMLVGTLSTTMLTSCTKEDEASKTDLNRALISIGDEYFAIDIEEYIKRTEACTVLKLTDGTSVEVHPSDLNLYNRQSEVMQNVEDSLSVIQTDSINNVVGKEDYDSAFVQVGDSVVVVEITGYNRWSQSSVVLYLIDGTSLEVHPMDLILFNSKSSAMSQVQTQTLNKDYVKMK